MYRPPKHRHLTPEEVEATAREARRLLEETKHRRPAVWTWEYAGVRLVEAYDVLLRMPAVSGPRQPRTGWREIMRTAEEINEYVRFTRAEKLPERRERPTKLEIERMEKVVDWPMRFLDGRREISTCVTYWSLWTAADLDVDTMVSKFFKTADCERFHERRRNGLIIIAAGLNRVHEAVS